MSGVHWLKAERGPDSLVYLCTGSVILLLPGAQLWYAWTTLVVCTLLALARLVEDNGLVLVELPAYGRNTS